MNQSNSEQLITEQAATIADQMNKIAQWAKSEEDVRYDCNKLIDEFIEKALFTLTVGDMDQDAPTAVRKQA